MFDLAWKVSVHNAQDPLCKLPSMPSLAPSRAPELQTEVRSILKGSLWAGRLRSTVSYQSECHLRAGSQRSHKVMAERKVGVEGRGGRKTDLGVGSMGKGRFPIRNRMLLSSVLTLPPTWASALLRAPPWLFPPPMPFLCSL